MIYNSYILKSGIHHIFLRQDQVRLSGLDGATTLSELQEILPRKRKRADAYRTVSKKLSEMGVQLVIKRENGHGKV